MNKSISLTDREAYQIALSMNARLCSRETYFTKGDSQVFNKAMEKIRWSAKGRKNERDILGALGDETECSDCGCDFFNGEKCDCW